MIDRFKEFFELIKSKAGTGSAAELSWVFFGQILNVGLSFVILKLLSKMGTNDYGIYALILTISTLLSSIFYGPVLQGFIRFYYNYLEQGLVNVYLKLVYKFLFITISAFLGITVLLFLSSFFIDFLLPPLLFLFAGIFIITGRMGEFFNAFLNLIRKRKENSLLQGGERLSIAVMLLILILSNRLNLVNIFILLSIITALFGFIKFNVFRKNIHSEKIEPGDNSVNKEIKNKIFMYAIPFVLWGISGWLQLNGEKWIIAGILSTSIVGIYAVMMSLVTAFIVVPATILSEFSTPIIFQNYSNPDNPEKTKTGYIYIKFTMLLIFLVTVAATIISAVFGEQIIIIISSRAYSLYWYLLPFLCLGTGLFYSAQALTSLGLALNKPEKYLAPKILTGVISVILYYILISRYGINGVVYTTVFTGIMYLIYIIIVNKKLISSMDIKI